jgi:hypothetical protein
MVDLLNGTTKWMKVKAEIAGVGWDCGRALAQARDLRPVRLVHCLYRPARHGDCFCDAVRRKGDNIIIDKKNPKSIKGSRGSEQSERQHHRRARHAQHDNAQRFFPKAHILAVKVPSMVQVIDWVKRGDADAAVLPTITARWWLNVPENAAWAVMGFPDNDFGNAPNGWAVRQERSGLVGVPQLVLRLDHRQRHGQAALRRHIWSVPIRLQRIGPSALGATDRRMPEAVACRSGDSTD